MTGALRASVFLLNYYPPPGKINNSSIAFINVSSLISFHTIPISVYAMILIHLSKKGKHFYDFYSLVPRLKFLPLYIVVFSDLYIRTKSPKHMLRAFRGKMMVMIRRNCGAVLLCFQYIIL